MSTFNVNADLVPLFSGLVTGLKPFADAQQISLRFTAEVQHLYASYNPADVLAEITVFLSRIITFTPQSYAINVAIGICQNSSGRCIISIENTGVDLSRVVEILSTISKGLQITKLDKGTLFHIEIPVSLSSEDIITPEFNGQLTPKKYPFYFSAVSKRLASHFSGKKHLEKTLSRLNLIDGVFIKKVNAVIEANMSDSEFKVDTLANAMALSRSHLYRKMKLFTNMSPQEYLRFFRLERAKKMLQSKAIEVNVSEVCYQTGFASKSHFTRVFQKEFGFNPSELK
ncbi:MAG TPA: AraC family transcriptional regulator [Pricia antarctica]|uniref:AraC family transcriptional regulator n=2 Tax=root TaxID=1 RepID=A0A831VP84_9FLAO|nr:AraC family transcriptional regulator [Pricia antarctica]